MKCRNKKIIQVIPIVLLFTACSSNNQTKQSSNETAISSTTGTSDNTTTQLTIPTNAYGNYSTKDITSDYDESAATKITFEKSSAQIDGSGAQINEDTLTINQGGTYILSGDFSGQVKIDANDQNVFLILKNVSITSGKSSAIYVKAAKNTYVTLPENSDNYLEDAKEYQFSDTDQEEPSATLFSKDDLTINGSGKLSIKGNYNNGIQSKDDLVISSGEVTIEAVNNGIKGKDSVSILSGNFSITTQSGDGIQASNTEDSSKGWIGIDGGTFAIQAGNDGIQAETTLSIQEATISVKTGDGASMQTIDSTTSYKGLKSTGNLLITSGKLTIDSADDSLHSNGNITIDGGEFELSSADDGVHADVDLVINDGKITVKQSYEGLEGATVTINGGYHIVNATDDGINSGGGSDGDSSDDTFGSPGEPGGMGQADASKIITITGGTVFVQAEGDGIDSNGNVNMSGGLLLVDGPVSGGNGALDYDGTWNQTGGTILAIGTSDMAELPSDSSSQSSLGIYLDQTQTERITLSIGDETLFSYQPKKSYSHIVASSPSFSDGAQVTVTLGGEVSGEEKDGYIEKGTLTNGNVIGTYTLSGAITSVNQDGSTASNQGMGGRMGF